MASQCQLVVCSGNKKRKACRLVFRQQAKPLEKFPMHSMEHPTYSSPTLMFHPPFGSLHLSYDCLWLSFLPACKLACKLAVHSVWLHSVHLAFLHPAYDRYATHLMEAKMFHFIIYQYSEQEKNKYLYLSSVFYRYEILVNCLPSSSFKSLFSTMSHAGLDTQ